MAVSWAVGNSSEKGLTQNICIVTDELLSNSILVKF